MMTSHECLQRAQQCDRLADATTMRSMKRVMADTAVLWRNQAAKSASQELAKQLGRLVEQAREALADGDQKALVRAVKGLAFQPRQTHH